jgi:hypothetical protein
LEAYEELLSAFIETRVVALHGSPVHLGEGGAIGGRCPPAHRCPAKFTRYSCRALSAAASVLAVPFASIANHTGQTTIPTTPAATFCTTLVFCSEASSSARLLFAWISALIIEQSL